MISEKKIELLEIAGRIEIGYVRNYAILSGSKEYTATRKRLAELCQDGFMHESWRNGRKVYYLTKQGLAQIESHLRKPYNPAGFTTDHALYVADYASYLHLKGNISVDSMIFDREMEHMQLFKPNKSFSKQNRPEKTHAPDLIIGNRCYEIELNSKSKARLRENFSTNAKYFEKQVWIVPSRLKSLQASLRALGDELNCPTVIVPIEKVEAFLLACNIRNNGPGKKVALNIKEPAIPTILEELS